MSKVWGLAVLAIVAVGPLWMPSASAAGDDTKTKTFTLTGNHVGGFNIQAQIEGKKQQVPMSAADADMGPSGAAQAPPAAPPPQALFQKAGAAGAMPTPNPSPTAGASPVASPTQALFQMAPKAGPEDHHHGGPESHHNPPSPAASPSPTPTPAAGPAFVPNAGTDSLFPIPPNGDCEGFAGVQMTGKPLAELLNQLHGPPPPAGQPDKRELSPDDIKKLAEQRGYNPPKTVNPGSKLPDKFPPGTVLQFEHHCGIVGEDGTTIYNYTMPAKSQGLPATIHKTPSANDLWNKNSGGRTPYKNHPVTIFTPPGSP